MSVFMMRTSIFNMTARFQNRTHWHRHEPLTHTHAHYPEAHHRHTHE